MFGRRACQHFGGRSERVLIFPLRFVLCCVRGFGFREQIACAYFFLASPAGCMTISVPCGKDNPEENH